MKKVLKAIYSILIIALVIYITYRNIKLNTIPSVDLIKDEATTSLYNRIMPYTDNLTWTNYYFSKDLLTNKDIPEDMKYHVAFRSLGISENIFIEENLKNAYERIFGNGTYKKTDSFFGQCNTYTYNENKMTYEKTKTKKCDDKKVSIVSKIIDAEKTDEYMTITVAIVYLDNIERKVYRNCNNDMTSCSNVLVTNFDNFDEADLNISEYKPNKYIFTYNADGENYYFSKVEKIK